MFHIFWPLRFHYPSQRRVIGRKVINFRWHFTEWEMLHEWWALKFGWYEVRRSIYNLARNGSTNQVAPPKTGKKFQGAFPTLHPSNPRMGPKSTSNTSSSPSHLGKLSVWNEAKVIHQEIWEWISEVRRFLEFPKKNWACWCCLSFLLQLTMFSRDSCWRGSPLCPKCASQTRPPMAQMASKPKCHQKENSFAFYPFQQECLSFLR